MIKHRKSFFVIEGYIVVISNFFLNVELGHWISDILFTMGAKTNKISTVKKQPFINHQFLYPYMVRKIQHKTICSSKMTDVIKIVLYDVQASTSRIFGDAFSLKNKVYI